MINYIILGMFQGLTEFLPVSSSGHLVILQKILNIQEHLVASSVVLHLGTLLSILIFFRKEIVGLLADRRLFIRLCLTVIITGLIGIAGKNFFEGLFSSTKAVALAWMATGFILLATKKITQLNRDQLGSKDALILGLVQALAIIPGVSRSGITISTLFFRKIKTQLAFSVSFLVSIPVIIGATLLELPQIEALAQADIKSVLAGLISSFVFGLIALKVLKLIIHKAKFYYFGYYCLAMAIITLGFVK